MEEYTFSVHPGVDAQLYDLAEPRADAMIQSLRAFGYDLPTAIADLIDNSISAEAKNIWLDFHWSGRNSCIAVTDDGQGMSEIQLISAMRPGSRSPLEIRDPKDLGRFGLGLKTASFSQCLRTTVGTKTLGESLAARCWDLEYVTQTGQWRLLHGGSEEAQRWLTVLDGKPSGTSVIWEKMDRLTTGTDVNSEDDHALFLARADQVRQHIAMVFHRFLEGHHALRIYINGSPVKPWDPFLTKEPATQLLADESIALFGSRLHILPYVLPHHSKTSIEIYNRAAGPHGWNAQQGFYVYRNKRLLAAGDWLGLGLQRAEHYKLARILLDIPNSMDAQWEIDVKKSRASPPPAIRPKLKALANLTRAAASGIYRHRGARVSRGTTEQVLLWERRVLHSQISYAINRDHPLVQAALSGTHEETRRVKALLSVVEETVPVPTIIMDGSEAPEAHAKPFSQTPPAAMQAALELTYKALMRAGFDDGQAKIRLLNTEPFDQFPEAVMALAESTQKQEDIDGSVSH